MSTRIGSTVQGVVIGVVTAVVFLLVGIALGPTVIDAVSSVNATLLSGVPMSSVIILLAQYLGFFYYLGIVLGAIAMIWTVVNRRH